MMAQRKKLNEIIIVITVTMLYGRRGYHVFGSFEPHCYLLTQLED